ncbi:hypothetical protein, partial [Caballeronia sp.]|uniref:hypothetical protein n=1 Tax=Caballeronia sp. TaxID=1931223 RepID=UPI002620BEE0
HAARQFGVAKYRFARVATDLSHALFFDGRFKAWIPQSNHQCVLCIISVYPIASVVVDTLSFTTPVSGSLCIVVASSETQSASAAIVRSQRTWCG